MLFNFIYMRLFWQKSAKLSPFSWFVFEIWNFFVAVSLKIWLFSCWFYKYVLITLKTSKILAFFCVWFHKYAVILLTINKPLRKLNLKYVICLASVFFLKNNYFEENLQNSLFCRHFLQLNFSNTRFLCGCMYVIGYINAWLFPEIC